MLRVKVPGGLALAASSCARSARSRTCYGSGDGELSTRQNIQLHWLELAKLPDVFDHLDAAGVTTAGGCGDTVRNITGCPRRRASPPTSSSTRRRCSSAAADLFYGNPD